MSKSKQSSSKTLKVKTSVKAGPNKRWPWWASNHNETQVREPKKARTLKVKTNVKAGLGGAPRYLPIWL